jgi:carbamoyl-phosphate synthase large subunit
VAKKATAKKVAAGKKDRIIILGGGPNRIGQGIEFDYCCVHAAYAIREAGYEAILINSNPETVSTDFDTSDRLYFEPLTFEDVMNIIDHEKPKGVIVQLGGQTPLNLAIPLMKHGAPILGTSPDSIDRAEDRKRFQEMLNKLGLRQPENATATSAEQAVKKAARIGYPLLVRPSYVLGGRAMEIVYDETDLTNYMEKAVKASPDRPVLLDKFLQDAAEIDVDCVADGERCLVIGVMEHIEEAGVHSGDSACSLPPFSLKKKMVDEIKSASRALAAELDVRGLMNIQFAVKDDTLYIIEVNPRASRTVPFVSKATGIPWAKVATRVMLGESLKKQGVTKEVIPEHMSVKEAVFPFVKFPGVDVTLGPEMRSTGEVMGIDKDFGMAFIKSQLAAGVKLPSSGTVFMSVNDHDKPTAPEVARQLVAMGFRIIATSGTLALLKSHNIACDPVHKVGEGRPNVLDVIKNGDVHLIINTPFGKATKQDETLIRSTATARGIPIITTLNGARATVTGMQALRKRGLSVTPLQTYHEKSIGRETVNKFLTPLSVMSSSQS